MKQINSQKIQNKLRNKFIKSGDIDTEKKQRIANSAPNKAVMIMINLQNYWRTSKTFFVIQLIWFKLKIVVKPTIIN